MFLLVLSPNSSKTTVCQSPFCLSSNQFLTPALSCSALLCKVKGLTSARLVSQTSLGSANRSTGEWDSEGRERREKAEDFSHPSLPQAGSGCVLRLHLPLDRFYHDSSFQQCCQVLGSDNTTSSFGPFSLGWWCYC